MMTYSMGISMMLCFHPAVVLALTVCLWRIICLSFLPSFMFWSQANDEKKNRDILKFLWEYDDIFDGNLYDAFALELILFCLLV